VVEGQAVIEQEAGRYRPKVCWVHSMLWKGAEVGPVHRVQLRPIPGVLHVHRFLLRFLFTALFSYNQVPWIEKGMTFFSSVDDMDDSFFDRSPTSSIEFEQSTQYEIRCLDVRFSPDVRSSKFTRESWESMLDCHFLSLECDAAFVEFPRRQGGTCWHCSATYALMDDSHGHGPYAVPVKLEGQNDEDARYIVGENLDGWALAVWAGAVALPEGHLADRFWGV